MCRALISPAKRERAAASAAAPSDNKITIAGVLAASCAVKAIPAGVALSRASSQKSPTFGGSSGKSGVTGTYAGSGVWAGGSVVDITLHLTAFRVGEELTTASCGARRVYSALIGVRPELIEGLA